jgi:hypothetical protein
LSLCCDLRLTIRYRTTLVAGLRFQGKDKHVVSNTLELGVCELAHLMRVECDAMNNGSAFSAVNLLGATQPVLYVQTQEHYHYFISASQSCLVMLPVLRSLKLFRIESRYHV